MTDQIELRRLGRTGVHVSALCLGTMMFGALGNPDHDDAISIIRRAIDAGINFIDTADVYSSGESEEIVGKAIAGRRDEIVLASKFHGAMGDGPNRRGNSRRWIHQAVEGSLRRLRTDWIDLYQIHRPEPETELAETLGALDDLVRQGKIRYVGTSAFSGADLVEAQWIAARRAFTPPHTEQSPYSLLVRAIEAEVLPTAARYGVGVVSYGPLAAGWLSGRYRIGEPQPDSQRAGLIAGRFDVDAPANAAKLAAADALAQLAESMGLSLIDLAIAFVLAHPAISATIIGPRTHEHLDSYLRAGAVRLEDDVLDRIDEIVTPGTNFRPRDAGYLPPSVTDPAQRRASRRL
jgi:aryl-alcohol dehydrogenase-like predicted oxidoreductase